jgi:hypothetical protein
MSFESLEEKRIEHRLPTVEAIPADRVVTDPAHAWHAVRGFDFAGLEDIVTNGLRPADNQGSSAVCMSASPTISHSVGREANSFYAYTLQNGISLAVNTESPVYPRGVTADL